MTPARRSRPPRPLNQVREALANLRGDHAGLQDKLEDTQSAHADAQSQLEKLTQAAAAKEAALAKDLAARQAEIVALNKQLDQVRQQAQSDLQAAQARGDEPWSSANPYPSAWPRSVAASPTRVPCSL